MVVDEVDGVAVVRFPDQAMLDSLAVEALTDPLHQLLDQRRQRGVVLDFGNVHFLSSPALSMLLTLRRKADAAAREVVVAQARPDILRLFRITKLDKLFYFFDTVPAALAHFAPSGSDQSPASRQPI